MRQFFNLLFGLIMLLGTVNAQQTQATASLSQDSMAIGERISYELNLLTPNGALVEWPVWNDTLPGGIEIITQGKVEEVKGESGANSLFRQNIILTAFDAGQKSVPKLRIRIKNASDTTHYIAETNPVFFYVHTVKVDTSQAFKPLIGPRSEPVTFLEVLPWILGGLGVLLLLAGIYWYIKRRKKILPVIQAFAKPQLPPHLIALERLEELRYSKIWQSGKIKEYYTALTDIVRIYLEDQFKVMAVEMTTDEILQGIATLNINPDASKKLSEVLHLSDFVKFAKASPGAIENDLSLNYIIDFVKESHGVVAATLVESENVQPQNREEN